MEKYIKPEVEVISVEAMSLMDTSMTKGKDSETVDKYFSPRRNSFNDDEESID